ncbi:MAG: TetR/AcrR family transcriptional regulator [Eubacteriales bacterium]|nr:TetR/AcrR family transcriptional regulator [Eubacteriales bacterium]
MVRVRKTPQERREEILEAARTCFLENGFVATTMEDVIARTSLSKGGVYRYYDSTVDMLHDLMRAGTQLRLDIIHEQMKPFEAADADEIFEMIVEQNYRKMVDENKYKKLYAMFLMEAERNETLRRLKRALYEEFYDVAKKIPGLPVPAAEWTTYIDFINMVIVGVELMGMRESMTADPDFLKDTIRSFYIKNGLRDELVKQFRERKENGKE